MQSNLLNLYALLALVLPLTALAGNHGSLLNRGHHHDLAKKAEGNTTLSIRGPGSRWSFYDVETGNAGSCGKFHKNSDFTVALSAAMMNPSYCFKKIRMTYNGKTTYADITDTCPGCPYNGLDLTEGLFQFFAPASAGIIYGDWELGDGPAPAPAKTTPKPTPKPTPTSTKPKPTTTSTKASTSSTPATSSKPSATPSSSAASSQKSSTPVADGNLDNIGQVFVQLGGIIAAGNALD